MRGLLLLLMQSEFKQPHIYVMGTLRHLAFLFLASLGLFSIPVMADSVTIPPGANLTLGNTSHSNGFLYIASNPAAPAALPESQLERGFGVAVGAGLEYGNVDEIFELIDRVAALLGANDGNDEGSGGGPVDPLPPPPDDIPTQLPTDLTWQDILDANPQFQEWIDVLSSQAAFLAGATALIASEAYAKAFLTFDVPVVLNRDLLGGRLVFSLSSQGTSKALGIVDGFDFDPDYALEQIDQARNLTPDDPETTFYLSDDVLLTIDPQSNSIRLRFDNDSLLLTKAAFIQSLDFGYSREWFTSPHGRLFWGVKPKIMRAGLAKTDIRLGDITDAEELFDDIKSAEFKYANRLSVDLGLLWQSEIYNLGVTLSDPLSPKFNFPGFEQGKYQKSYIVSKLRRELSFELEAQLTADATLFTPNRKWSGHVQVDINSIRDPMGDDYQWASAALAFDSGKFLIPDFRAGIKRNLVGSELTYLSLGVGLFNVFTLDLSKTMEDVTIDDTTVPRGFNASLGFNFSF